MKLKNNEKKDLIKVISVFGFGVFAVLGVMGIVYGISTDFSYIGYVVSSFVLSLICFMIYQKEQKG